MVILMEKLDDLVVAHLEDRLLLPERLETTLARHRRLEALSDQAKVYAERAQAMLQNSAQQAGKPQMLKMFANTARQRIRLEGGGYRRDHLRALAPRVEVDTGEVRIMGSKSRLLQTLGVNGGVNPIPTQGPRWRRERTLLQTRS
jgi:hypothetical protein